MSGLLLLPAASIDLVDHYELRHHTSGSAIFGFTIYVRTHTTKVPMQNANVHVTTIWDLQGRNALRPMVGLNNSRSRKRVNRESAIVPSGPFLTYGKYIVTGSTATVVMDRIQ